MKGIARQLLCQVIADSYDNGCRSVIINTDPTDTPIQWYNRLGFTDEVHWRRTYLFDPSASPLNAFRHLSVSAIESSASNS